MSWIAWAFAILVPLNWFFYALGSTFSVSMWIAGIDKANPAVASGRQIIAFLIGSLVGIIADVCVAILIGRAILMGWGL